MKYLLIFLTIAILSCSSSKKMANKDDDVKYFNQDSLIYCQTYSPWVSNCFYFYKQDGQSNNGTFEKHMESDDGQYWWGTGTFIESKSKIVLSSYRIIRTLSDSSQKNKLASDTMLIPKQKFLKDGINLIQLDKKNTKTMFVRQSTIHN